MTRIVRIFLILGDDLLYGTKLPTQKVFAKREVPFLNCEKAIFFYLRDFSVTKIIKTESILKFWGEDISETINRELSEHENSLLIFRH